MRWPIDENLTSRPFIHLQIDIEDMEDENILEFFPRMNKFMKDALAVDGQAIFVHCAMGKSRSATTVIAYMMQQLRLNPTEALERLRTARPQVEPNDGFWEQLELFHEMGCPDTEEQLESSPKYQRWAYQREIDASASVGKAPELDKVKFGDEGAQKSMQRQGREESEGRNEQAELRCRRCRRSLATSEFIRTHEQTLAQKLDRPPNSQSLPCAHHFLEPMSWMRPELEQGKLEGRLECPKCHTNVGKYAWHGMQCSCSLWEVPGISLVKARIDEVKTTRKLGSAGGSAETSSHMGIRLPPGARPSTEDDGPGSEGVTRSCVRLGGKRQENL
ncbi:MAG: tyrosine protein phosphatase yvh1 [Alyxoria varia]|nr:MAG: tyrosine protein phosphatase yvh1 [Alyxoria varia]